MDSETKGTWRPKILPIMSGPIPGNDKAVLVRIFIPSPSKAAEALDENFFCRPFRLWRVTKEPISEAGFGIMAVSVGGAWLDKLTLEEPLEVALGQAVAVWVHNSSKDEPDVFHGNLVGEELVDGEQSFTAVGESEVKP